MAGAERRKWKCCHKLFRPDPRNRHHQRYCAAPSCRAASKAASQARWSAAPPGEGVAIAQSRLLASILGFHLNSLPRMKWAVWVEHGFDLAIRAGVPPDSNLITRRLGSASWTACAAPDYLARFGYPATATELTQHNCLTYAPLLSDGKWHFADRDGEYEVNVFWQPV
jgi:hypothetical protein